MKVFKLNSFTIIFLALILGGAVFYVPVFCIEFLWNKFIGSQNTFLNINFFQALILWFTFLTFLYILKIFKFEFSMESYNSFDKELLKQKLEKLNKQVKSELENPPNDTQEKS